MFDASSKTPGGESLNNLLAKGTPEMVRLIDMMLDWSSDGRIADTDLRDSQFRSRIKLYPYP